VRYRVDTIHLNLFHVIMQLLVQILTKDCGYV